MSKFVNYKKRDFALPPGCKNLIDVLRLRESRDVQDIIGTDLSSCVSCGGGGIGGLKDIEKYVAMAFESRGLAFGLIIIPPDKRPTVDVSRMEHAAVEVSVSVQMDTETDTAVCDFFRRHHLQTPSDSWTPQHFNRNLPILVRYAILPVPTEVGHLARLLADLFREVCGLTEGSSLSFRCDEIIKVA